MSDLPIYTALNVPTVISHPSAHCLQWSGDGQACFVTKSAVYILTPDPGINFDTTSVLKAPVGRADVGDKPLGWFRTMIECSKEGLSEKPHSWPDVSQDWGAVSLGSLDIAVRSLACSPSNLTVDGRCILAALNSNMEISLWAAAKNHLKGEWVHIQNVTTYLISHFSLPENKPSLAAVLRMQTTSIAWSTQPVFGIFPSACIDSSLIATGNRAGSVLLLRYQQDTGSGEYIRHLETVEVSQQWITQIAWAPWALTSTAACRAYLAFGTADGAVGLIAITQTLQSAATGSGIGENYTPLLACSIFPQQPSEPDGRAISVIYWVETANKNLILVYCKPGVVHLWSAASLTAASPIWTGTRTIRLQTQSISAGSSALLPVSGVIYEKQDDALIISLYDGSFHVIHGLSVDPSYLPPHTPHHLASENLSAAARALFVRVEAREIRRKDVNCTGGMMSYDHSSTIVWAHEACRPTDFSYKHEAKHNVMLVVAQLWGPVTDQQVVDNLSRILSDTKSAAGSVPIHLLRPVLLHISKSGASRELRDRILQVLQEPLVDDSAGMIINSEITGGLDPGLRLDFRRSLTRHLFGWDYILNLRMRLAVADLCWKLSAGDLQAQAECGQVAQNLLAAIVHWVLRIMIRHLTIVISTITPLDVPFVVRNVIQGLLPGLPPDLSLEAQNLSARMNGVLPGLDQEVNGITELCPACHVAVPLMDITRAVCDNGHVWARCSVTSFILATPVVRTCVGCSRKAFLPLSRRQSDGQIWLPTAAQSWIVEELLEAVNCCLFCGNSFVSIL